MLNLDIYNENRISETTTSGTTGDDTGRFNHGVYNMLVDRLFQLDIKVNQG